MDLVLNLQPELVDRLREKAVQDGIQPEACALKLLEDQLTTPPPWEMNESELLLEASRGLPESVWQRFRELIEVRQEEELNETDHHEFVELNELVEKTYARRMTYVAELALRRSVPLRDLMNELGFPDYGRA
ncbi:MAG: hypothetical protein CMJ64_13610 [Planctomycetaceae bacterium]|nr:hypothetical protein [Planctomycetaceae bacterium]